VADQILVVDDSLTVRMDLAEAFERAGFQPLLASSGAAAREVLTRVPVSLVVLDVVLPDADGIELLAEIKAVPNRKVILLSTEAEVRDRIRGLRTGADDYVGKPYDAGYLVARARELLHQSSTPAGGVASVLLIDDSPTFRASLAAALRDAGHEVIVAENGEEGLRLAAVHRPRMIVVDGVMPGIDGTTVIRRVRLDAAMRSTLCVLLTGSSGADAELRALDSGADAFVRKEEDLQVILARLAAVLRHAPDRDETGESLSGPKRILAVDDSQTYLNEVASMLRGEGYDVVAAHSGPEALEMLAAQRVDCVLLDLVMPLMDGNETCRRIKGAPITRDVPLIMLTGHDDRKAMLESLSSGADDYIAKSADFDVVKARVRAQLRRRQFEDEHRRVREQLLRSEITAAEERAARELAEARAQLVEELEQKNRELEAFSYSVSHDLRAPLRTIDGFSRALLEDSGDRLDETGRGHLDRVVRATRRMEELIDAMLKLSRVSRGDLSRQEVDLSKLAHSVADELKQREPERQFEVVVTPDLTCHADPTLTRALFENLLGNAFKFTARAPRPRIEVGRSPEGEFFVRDNGAGFPQDKAERLFAPFSRLHRVSDFPGTGIGLATVMRIAQRHGGHVRVEAAEGKGACFYFTLTASSEAASRPPRLKPSNEEGSALTRID
jgi:two-component system, NtrC family, sensor kinase